MSTPRIRWILDRARSWIVKRQTEARVSALAVLIATGACLPITPDPRVPLPVPFPAVEGATPAVGSGVFIAGSFGDGFWGQERERAELTGFGIGAAFLDRFEVEWHEYTSNRTVDDEHGQPHEGSPARTLRVKARLLDSPGGAWSLGIVGARSTASRMIPDVQDEHATAWDVAVPVEYVRLATGESRNRLALYTGARLLRQSFESNLAATPGPTEDAGVAWGGLLGLKGRLGWLHLAAEGSLMNAPGLQVGSHASEDGWMFIPALSARFVIPIGEGNEVP